MKQILLTFFLFYNLQFTINNCKAQERFVRILDDTTYTHLLFTIKEHEDSLILSNVYPIYHDSIPVWYNYTNQTRLLKFDKNNIHGPYRFKIHYVDTVLSNQFEPKGFIKEQNTLTYIASLVVNDSTDTLFLKHFYPYLGVVNNSNLDLVHSTLLPPYVNGVVVNVKSINNLIYVTYLNDSLETSIYFNFPNGLTNGYSGPRYTLACYDTSFNLLWHKSDYTTPNNGNYMSSDLIKADSGTYIVGGTETYNSFEMVDGGQGQQVPFYTGDLYANGYIWKLDSLGNRLWSKMLPYRDSTVTREPLLKALPDSTFLAIYTETFNNYGNQEISDSAGLKIAKYDYEGNLIWCKRLKEDLIMKVGNTYGWMNGFVSFSTQLLDLNDNKLLLLLNTEMAGLLIKMDYDGNIQWGRQIEADTACIYSQTYVYDVDIAADSSFYLCGNVSRYVDFHCPEITSFGKPGFVMHVDKFGCLEPGCQLTDGIEKLSFESEIVLYPNPTTDEINITTGGVFDSNKPITISISNYTGQVVFANQFTTTFANINVKDYANGLYIVTLAQQGKQSVYKKVVKR